MQGPDRTAKMDKKKYQSQVAKELYFFAYFARISKFKVPYLQTSADHVTQLHNVVLQILMLQVKLALST